MEAPTQREGSSKVEYNWIEDVETLERYEPGGYHPVALGEVYNNRYLVINKLGFGGESTVWLAVDQRLQQLVALKIGISDSGFPRQEAEILRNLATPESMVLLGSTVNRGLQVFGLGLLPELLDAFQIRGPNGLHPCSVYEPTQGDLHTASFNRLFRVDVARTLCAAIVLAVARVHGQGYVHGDIRLGNIMVKLPLSFRQLSVTELHNMHGQPYQEAITRLDKRALTCHAPSHAVESLELITSAEDFSALEARSIVLGDFGLAWQPHLETRLGREAGIPEQMRPPETYFEPESAMSFPSDIWSLAVALWEVVGMRCIYPECTPFEEIVAYHIDVLGLDSFPPDWWRGWQDKYKWFKAKGTSTELLDENWEKFGNRDVWPTIEQSWESCVQTFRREDECRGKSPGIFGSEESRAFLDLMRRMMRFRPAERLTIKEVLSSEWMSQWAIPALEEKLAQSDSSHD